MTDADPTSLALGASLIVKTLIDLLKMGVTVPPWMPPALALLGGVGIVLLGMVGAGTVLTVQAVAIAIQAGVLAGGMAVGVTELAKRARKAK